MGAAWVLTSPMLLYISELSGTSMWWMALDARVSDYNAHHSKVEVDHVASEKTQSDLDADGQGHIMKTGYMFACPITDNPL